LPCCYVALSRVTSPNGLYLINFDSSSVFASEEAIIEYNRLKQIHNPESLIITISKERYRKVKDVPWTVSKTITSVQESDKKTLAKNTAWICDVPVARMSSAKHRVVGIFCCN